MRTLKEAIDKMQKGAGGTLRKHLSAVGIYDWKDVTRSALYEFHDHLTSELAPNTVKTVMAYAKSLFNRYCEEIELPTDWRKILTAKAVRPMNTYLTEDELTLFASAPTHTGKQELVKNLFLICAFTGLRVSDAKNLRVENITDGVLRYVAQKTKKAGSIPLKPGLEERIKWVSDHPEITITTKCYNEAVRRMCKLAGIDDEVVVQKAGKEERGPKWQFASSHAARRSCATNLYTRGAAVQEISTILSHSGTAMTERYLCAKKTELSSAAKAFFS
jgi:integrase